MAHLLGIRIGAFARGLTAALLLGTAILSFSPGQPESSQSGDVQYVIERGPTGPNCLTPRPCPPPTNG